MMGYYEESKAYRLFNRVKQHIIIMCKVIFDEKTSGLGLLKSPYDPSYNNTFGIVEGTKSNISPICISTSSLTYVPKLTGSQSTPTETVTSPNYSIDRNEHSSTPCLPWLDVMTIEF